MMFDVSFHYNVNSRNYNSAAILICLNENENETVVRQTTCVVSSEGVHTPESRTTEDSSPKFVYLVLRNARRTMSPDYLLILLSRPRWKCRHQLVWGKKTFLRIKFQGQIVPGNFGGKAAYCFSRPLRTQQFVKGLVHHKIKILSVIPHAVPN